MKYNSIYDAKSDKIYMICHTIKAKGMEFGSAVYNNWNFDSTKLLSNMYTSEKAVYSVDEIRLCAFMHIYELCK